jgi:hypothetical protein
MFVVKRYVLHRNSIFTKSPENEGKKKLAPNKKKYIVRKRKNWPARDTKTGIPLSGGCMMKTLLLHEVIH